MKLVHKILVFVALLIVIVVIVGIFSIDGLIRQAVQSQATTALGCKAHLADASLSLFAGKLGLSDLTIAEPSGYGRGRLLRMKSCRITVRVHSLLGHTVKVKTIRVNGLLVNIDQHGLSSNVQQVLAYIHQHQQPAAGAAGAAPSSGKQLRINQVILTNLTVHIAVTDLPGVAPSITIPLQKIEIDQPTNPDGRPLRIADLVRQILVQVVGQAMRSGKMPSVVHQSLGDIQSLLQGSGSLLQKDTSKLVGGLNSSLNKLFHGGTGKK
jgi:hypothetical protein